MVANVPMTAYRPLDIVTSCCNIRKKLSLKLRPVPGSVTEGGPDIRHGDTLTPFHKIQESRKGLDLTVQPEIDL
jgi:hypothetical protein